MLSLPNGVGADVIVYRKCLPLSTLGVGKYFATIHNRYPGAGPYTRFPCFLIPGRAPAVITPLYIAW